MTAASQAAAAVCPLRSWTPLTPIALHMTLAESALPDPGIDQREIPQQILDSFGEPLAVTGGSRHVYVTLGQFSIVRLERSTQLLIPAYDYCLPDKECAGSSEDDPCTMFGRIRFPVDEFFPPDNPGDCDEYRDLV